MKTTFVDVGYVWAPYVPLQVTTLGKPKLLPCLESTRAAWTTSFPKHLHINVGDAFLIKSGHYTLGGKIVVAIAWDDYCNHRDTCSHPLHLQEKYGRVIVLSNDGLAAVKSQYLVNLHGQEDQSATDV